MSSGDSDSDDWGSWKAAKAAKTTSDPTDGHDGLDDWANWTAPASKDPCKGKGKDKGAEGVLAPLLKNS